jgi:hypothetical protein
MIRTSESWARAGDNFGIQSGLRPNIQFNGRMGAGQVGITENGNWKIENGGHRRDGFKIIRWVERVGSKSTAKNGCATKK